MSCFVAKSRDLLLERTGSTPTVFPVGSCVVCDTDSSEEAIRLACGAQMHSQCFDWFFADADDDSDCPGCDTIHLCH